MMFFAALLSATFTFTASATGVEKGTTVEFFLVGPDSDRAYESLFVLDESVGAFCARLDAAVPHGAPVDPKACRLWPIGCHVTFDPPLERYVAIQIPEKGAVHKSVYTGGFRSTNGVPVAVDVMPSAVFAFYSLAQSPIVFSDPVDQGSAYGSFTARETLEKGKRFTFRIDVDEKTLPQKLDLTVEKGKLGETIRSLRDASQRGEVSARVSFADNLFVEESIAVARALAGVDSALVKINGSSNIFYRAFLPLEKWRDRQERLHQPFELTLRPDGTDELLFIEEDWTVEGDDPKLTPRKIPFSQSVLHADTDTCFIYASPTQSIGRICRAISRLANPNIVNWYVFQKD